MLRTRRAAALAPLALMALAACGSGSDAGQTPVTTTPPPVEPPPSASLTTAKGARASATTRSDGTCGTVKGFLVIPGTPASCGFAMNVATGYFKSGSGTFEAVDPDSGRLYRMSCPVPRGTTVCGTADGHDARAYVTLRPEGS